MARTPPGQTRDKVYRFVRERLLAGAPPTLREVQHALGFAAVESARTHLEALVDAGLLTRARGQARSYRLANAKARPPAYVPVLGEVQAGALRAAVEDPDGYVLVEAGVPAAELFALRVRGDSMVDAGILPGDLVIVRRQARAENGDLVVALVGDEATVKTLRLRGRRVELHPANPRYQPILPEPGVVRILGVVLEVRRTVR